MRNTYLASEVSPSVAEVRCYRGASFHCSFDRGGYDDVLDDDQSKYRGFVRIKRKRGVRLGEVFDALNGVVWRDMWSELTGLFSAIGAAR
jgi:hypothetical protein